MRQYSTSVASTEHGVATDAEHKNTLQVELVRTHRPVCNAIALPLVLASCWLVRHRLSPAVRKWRAGAGKRLSVGGLRVRIAGESGRVFLLLHGLVASGDYFGSAFDQLADGGRLIAPDLAGFGGSIDAPFTDYGLAGQLEALDSEMNAVSPGSHHVVVAGHSMGALLALWWAARHPEGVQRVVAWNPPLQRSGLEMRRAITRMSLFDRLFALDTDAAKLACAWMCRHRQLAGWLAAVANPSLPVPIARAGTQHTWVSYFGALEGILLRDQVETPLARLARAGVEVVLCVSSEESIADAAYAAELASKYPGCELRVVGGNHHLPLVAPAWCVETLRA